MENFKFEKITNSIICILLSWVASLLSFTLAIILIIALKQPTFSDDKCIDLIANTTTISLQGSSVINKGASDSTIGIVIALVVLVIMHCGSTASSPDYEIPDTAFAVIGYIYTRIEILLITIIIVNMSTYQKYSNFDWDCRLSENICDSGLCIYNNNDILCVTTINNNCQETESHLLEIAKMISFPAMIFFLGELMIIIVLGICGKYKANDNSNVTTVIPVTPV